MDRATVERKLTELEAEHRKGRQIVAQMEADLARARQTLLRLEGGITLARELLKEQPDEAQ